MRQVLIGAALLGALLQNIVFAQSASKSNASDYPVRPIRMVAGWPAGGGSDIIARAVSHQLSLILGQQVFVDNKVGAGNTIASDFVAKAAPDGYTLQFVNANHTLNAFVYDHLTYDTEKDFSPISQVSASALILVANLTLPVSSFKELMSLAKAKPGTLNAGTGGTAGSGAVTTEIFKKVSSMPFVTIPYKGGAEAILALIRGDIQFSIISQASSLSFVKSGKLKVFATSSKKRLTYLPDVPTFRELGLAGLDLGPWEGVIAPATVPQAIIEKLHIEIVRALRQTELVTSFSLQGVEVVGSSPVEFGDHIRDQMATFRQAFRGGKIGS